MKYYLREWDVLIRQPDSDTYKFERWSPTTRKWVPYSTGPLLQFMTTVSDLSPAEAQAITQRRRPS